MTSLSRFQLPEQGARQHEELELVEPKISAMWLILIRRAFFTCWPKFRICNIGCTTLVHFAPKDFSAAVNFQTITFVTHADKKPLRQCKPFFYVWCCKIMEAESLVKHLEGLLGVKLIAKVNVKMRHKLHNGVDVLQIAFFLREFTVTQECVLVLFRNENTQVHQCFYPRGGSPEQMNSIKLLLLEKLGPYSFVRFDLRRCEKKEEPFHFKKE
ncbi:hypothetical protein GPALN_004246 [Globodera pallida]|nr:hypothetical protein GPALN_004246 [Globodera pallida]